MDIICYSVAGSLTGHVTGVRLGHYLYSVVGFLPGHVTRERLGHDLLFCGRTPSWSCDQTKTWT